MDTSVFNNEISKAGTLMGFLRGKIYIIDVNNLSIIRNYYAKACNYNVTL